MYQNDVGEQNTSFPPQQMNHAVSQIDPQNPFENPLENREYRTDYRRILPQILLPNFQVPLFPDVAERRGIRRGMNTAGLGIFLSCVLNQLLFTILMFLILMMMGNSPLSYFMGNSADALDYFQNSSIFIALNGLLFSVMNVTAALVGLHHMRTPVRSLFQTTDFGVGKALRYISIGIGLQCVAGLIYTVLQWVLAQNGTQLAEADFSYYQSGKSIIAMVLYTCVLAPITEELLFRGFVMKTLSKVSIRFGIVASAALFGLAHGNVSQFLLAFLVGMFWGKIDVRHNSLLPSILVHISINTFSTLLSFFQEKSANAVMGFFTLMLILLYYAVVIIGIVFWFVKERKQPLPYPTQKQAIRSRVAWSSPWLIVAFAAQILVMVMNEVAVG